MTEISPVVPMLCRNQPGIANQALLTALGLNSGDAVMLHIDDVSTWHEWSQQPVIKPVDVRLRHSDATYRWFRCTSAEVNPYWTIATDITDLKASAGHLEACLQAFPDLLFEMDHDGRYLAYHSPLDRLFAPPETFLGRTIDEIMPPELTGFFNTAFAELLAAPTSTQTVRYDLTLASGLANYEARFTLSPAATVICAVRDITALAQSQAALATKNAQLAESNEELQEFAYAASHDLKQPLRMITEFMGLLQTNYAGDLDDTANAYITFATTGAERLRRLVDSLLLVSLTGTEGIRPATLDTAAVLTSLMADFASQIEATGATIHGSHLAPVWADPDQFRMLLGNLISNALKFHNMTEPPVVTVRCTTDGNTTTLAVQDNGIGIEPSHHHQLFGMFQRLHTQSSYEGTGMGLALCKRVAERHGGTLTVVSDGVTGSTFTLTLPTPPP